MQPPELDGVLKRSGWGSFEPTQVLRAALDELTLPPLPAGAITILALPEWEARAAPILDVPPDIVAQDIERARNYPLPQAGVVAEVDGEVVACGLVKLEADHAGLFAVNTAEGFRGRGLGRAVVSALLAEAKRRGARVAYLQVTTSNGPALALYRRFALHCRVRLLVPCA